MFNYAINELEWEGKNPFRVKMVDEKGRERSKVIGARLLPHQMPNFIEGLEACSEGMRVLFSYHSLYGSSRRRSTGDALGGP